MLTRLRELAAQRREFAFETTLASRTFAPWIAELTAAGYECHLVFVWLRSPEMAIKRVGARVRRGGHFVPDDVVRRRYARGIANFVNLYLPLATRWRALDNSDADGPSPIAYGRKGAAPTVVDQQVWTSILEMARDRTPPDDQ
jgi:predicted ABC-type ATPase